MFTYIRAGKPMTCVPEVAPEIFLACGIDCCPNCFPDQPCKIMKKIYIQYEGAEIVYDYHYYQLMLQKNIFIQSEAVTSYWVTQTGFLRMLSTILFSLPEIIFKQQ
jgi:hypothetical protein